MTIRIHSDGLIHNFSEVDYRKPIHKHKSCLSCRYSGLQGNGCILFPNHVTKSHMICDLVNVKDAHKMLSPRIDKQIIDKHIKKKKQE